MLVCSPVTAGLSRALEHLGTRPAAKGFAAGPRSLGVLAQGLAAQAGSLGPAQNNAVASRPARLSPRAVAPRFTRRFSGVANFTVDVPAMGDSITEGTVVEIQAAVGSFVHMDQVVAVLETDKVGHYAAKKRDREWVDGPFRLLS